MHYRDYHCGALRSEHVGKEVTLSGWVSSRRDHGGVIFIDLRDREGVTQVVFRPELHPQIATAAHQLHAEDVILVQGSVAERLVGTENPRLQTGAIEVVAQQLQLLNHAEVVPFPMEERIANEDLRLSYRYLDLRRPEMNARLQLRHRVTKTIRDFLDQAGFWEVETPILSKSTPEGARDFLVPSRLQQGHFYALPQAPQQYKQLLMVGGVERYFQIARCFRDEDLRADRQPEFTQVDIEASFVAQDDILTLMEGLIQTLFKKVLGEEITTPFERLSYHEAMSRFGSDKPDRRFGIELTDLSEVFRESAFKVFRGALDGGGVIKAINVKQFASITTGQIEELTKLAQSAGAKGLAFIKVEAGSWKSPIVKFFSETEKIALAKELQIEEGDLILFGADQWQTVCEVLGRIRLRAAQLAGVVINPAQRDFHWVVDFPLFAYSEQEQRWQAVHHPFTRPQQQSLEALAKKRYGEITAEAYDLVLNGVEVGGGSLRVHEVALQRQLFELLGISPEVQEAQFGHLLKALGFGAPPHGGIALGLDRLVALMAGEESIREVMAFPKNNRGSDLMSGAPAGVDPRDLKILGIKKYS